jgi:hypothetical protein
MEMLYLRIWAKSMVVIDLGSDLKWCAEYMSMSIALHCWEKMELINIVPWYVLFEFLDMYFRKEVVDSMSIEQRIF